MSNGDDSETTPQTSPWQPLPPSQLALVSAATASTGSALTTVVLFPLELVKNRLQASVAGGSFAYSGLVNGLATVLREDGVVGLYVGFCPVLLRALVS